MSTGGSLEIQQAQQTQQAAATGASKENRVLKQKCRDLEAVFIGYLLKTMRQSMVASDDEDSTKGIYEGITDQALSKALSENEALGIAKLLYQKLSTQDAAKSAQK